MASRRKEHLAIVENPLGFFKAFYEAGYLHVLRARFMPDATNPDDIIHRYPTKVDVENETYTIEYEIERAGHAEEYYPGYETWVTDECQTVVTSYSFKDYLLSRFTIEADIACETIDTLIVAESSGEKASLKCQVWLDHLAFYIRKHQEPEFKRYGELAVFLGKIVRYLYDKYKSFCPPTQSNTEIKTILTNITYNTKSSLGNKALKYTIFKSFLNLSDEHGELLIDFENSERSLTEAALITFAEGMPNMAETEVYFNWEAGAVGYILRRLNEFSPKMQLKVLEESNKVFINKKPFIARNASKAASIFGTKPAKASLRRLIDDLFNSHLG